MADNVLISVGTGTTFAAATDDIGGVQYQKIKLILGAENAADGPVDMGQQAMAASLPVVIASNQSAIPAPADPFGANADAAIAAGAAGSIQAKLRLMTTQLDAIQTAVQLLDNTVAGSELQVDIVGGGLTPSRAATAVLANVASSASSVTLQASNAARLSVVLMNDSTQILYVKYGSTASATSFTYKMQAFEQLREDLYTGIITGIWASANGSARLTELTA